jgi:hypothetical protein
MSWYQQCMPTVKTASEFIKTACDELKSIKGVNSLYLWGSYAQHINDPNYVVKDIDVIAVTNFDSGDLLAIDNSKYSALKMRSTDLEDMGFDPAAVNFTKRFLSYQKYNIDHWAASADGQLLHWGLIPDSQDEWQELHNEAELRAKKHTALSRADLLNASDEKKTDWKRAYDSYIAKYLNDKATGWYPSEHPLDEIISTATKV